jgi:hypothetical protein
LIYQTDVVEETKEETKEEIKKEIKKETRCSLLKTARLGTYLDVSSPETPSSYNRKDEHCKVIKIIQIA